MGIMEQEAVSERDKDVKLESMFPSKYWERYPLLHVLVIQPYSCLWYMRNCQILQSNN